MKEKLISQLIDIGASGFEHLNGSLLKHLEGTYMLLQSWGASNDLCIAGLYHAVYGTSGFGEVLVSESHRDKINRIIGKKPEEITYIYCACDRDFFWPQIWRKDNPVFRDRFTGQETHLSLEDLQYFCELTVANELEIARGNNNFIIQYGQSLSDLFQRMKPYISTTAINSITDIFGEI